MEQPVQQNALLDMLSVTNMAVNSIGNPENYHGYPEPNAVSTSVSSSLSHDSCKESVGSTTASEVLISSTYVGKSDIIENPLPKLVTVIRHNGTGQSETKVEKLKSQQNELLRLLSGSSFEEENTINDDNCPVATTEDANHSIISVDGRITNSNKRMPLSRQSETERTRQSETERTRQSETERTRQSETEKTSQSEREKIRHSETETKRQSETERTTKHLFENDRNHIKKGCYDSETGSSEKTVCSQDDVKIENFHLTEKQKSLRQALGKRSDHSVAVKRVIHPKFIQKHIHHQPIKSKEQVVSKENVSNEMLAASVAASAAAAVVQPFFQFQKDFEEKISLTYGKVTEKATTKENNDRIEELEKKVSALNEQRLDHLEKLQEYQMGLQAKIFALPCKQTTIQTCQALTSQSASSVQVVERGLSPKLSPPKRPSPKYFPQKMISAKMSPTRVAPPKRSPPRQEVKYFPVRKTESPRKAHGMKYREKQDSPLDTPAPRTRVPTPMLYNNDKISHPSDSHLNNAGLLEEILARNPTAQRDSTFSVPENPEYNRYDYTDGERPVDQASRLLDQMVDLKHQVGKVVEKKHDINYNYGPYPLDPYLKNPVSEAPIQSLQVNAPVFNNYGDVKKVLNMVNKKISLLEQNLKHVARVRQDDDSSCLSRVLSHGSDDEKLKIKSMVDKLIKSQRKMIEGDVEKELLDAKLKHQQQIEASKKTKDVNKKSVGRVPVNYFTKKEKPTLRSAKETKPSVYKPYGKNLLPSSSTDRLQPNGITTQKSEVKTIYKKLITQVKSANIPQTAAPAPIDVIPMAVPLCQPRFLSGRLSGVLSHEPIASSSPSTKTLLASMTIQSNIDETTFTELNQQMLSSPRRSPSEVYSPRQDSMFNNNEEDQFGTGIVLPGYQQEVKKPVIQPSKIASKPPVLESYRQNPSADVIATDIRRQNLLQDRAFQWLESELMVHVLSRVNRTSDENVKHERSLIEDYQHRYTNIDNGTVDNETDEESRLSETASSKSVPEDINEDIRKVFVDAGKPVNNQIISTLLREAIADRITAFLGQSQASTSGYGKQYKTSEEKEKDTVKDEYDDDDFESGESPELSVKQIPTPDLTPVSSRADSPIRQPSSPPSPKPSPQSPPKQHPPKQHPQTSLVEQPDDSMLYNSFLPSRPDQQTTVESESEISTSYDISQEIRRLAFKPDDKIQTVMASLHDIVTPVTTPSPRSPSPILQTLPHFTSSPPPVSQSVISPDVRKTDDRRQHDLHATGASFQTRISSDDYDIRELKNTTTVIRMSSNSLRESIDEPQKSPMQHPKPIISVQSPTRMVSPETDSHSPTPSHEPKSSLSSSVTDTINECISEGQWLLNRSEGQIAEIPIDQVVLYNVNFNKIDLSTASTLKDTEDLDLEDMDILRSEGEFFHYSSVPVEEDISNIIQRQQESLRREMNLLNHPTSNPEPAVTESMGELSIGQIQSSRIIQVDESQPKPSPRDFGRPDQHGVNVGTYSKEKLEECVSPDSTMNLEELDISKRKLLSPSKMRWSGPDKSRTTMSDGSLGNSGMMEYTMSDTESGYKFQLSGNSDFSEYSHDDDRDLDPVESGMPYRMSVTVPSVNPIAEDEDSEDISEIDATN